MGKVFIQTNEADGNRVIAFAAGNDGALEQVASVSTGGKGDGVPHLTSQGSVVLSQDGSRLLVANAGSDDVSVLAVGEDPSLEQVVPTGAAPKSITEHSGLVYVLNTEAPSLAGFRLAKNGLEPVEGSLRELAPGADPAQAGFSPDGSALLVTERGTDSLVVFPVEERASSASPQRCPRQGQRRTGSPSAPTERSSSPRRSAPRRARRLRLPTG
jgi:6-phosphogluconolactonase